MALHPPRNQSLQDHRGGPQLRSGAGCQGGGLVKDVDAEGGFVAGPVDVGTSGVVLGDGPLDDAGCDADAPVGEEVVQDEAADLADQVDNGLGDDTGGLHELVAGGVQGDGEAGPVGVDAGLGAGGVGHGQAEDLVAHQQGVDLLVDAGGGAGAQDSAEDAGFELQVGGFDLPPLVVEGDQPERRIAVVVEQGGGGGGWWSSRVVVEQGGGGAGWWSSRVVVEQGGGRAGWWSSRVV